MGVVLALLAVEVGAVIVVADFLLNLIAYNLIRIPKLVAA
jgi:hypothetical protein